MFNSELFTNITDYTDYDKNPLIVAVNEHYYELLDFTDRIWQERKASGISFAKHFSPFFPPGYIERDEARAREIYASLLHTSKDKYIRYDLPPISCFVMHALMSEYMGYFAHSKRDWCEDELKQYLERTMPNRSEIRVDRRDVKRWFTDPGEWLHDFETTYDEDYMHLDFILTMGTLYLQNNAESERAFTGYGIDIEAMSDLMPFDMRESVRKKIEIQKELIPVAEEKVYRTLLSACEKLSANPIDTNGLEEDALNRKVRDLLEMALETSGYVVQDQTQRGLGKKMEKPGELDILIKKNGLSIAIIEGLLHREKDWLYQHIEKAIGRYNTSGCRMIYILEYVRGVDFNQIVGNSDENFRTYPGLDYGNEFDTTLDSVRVFEGMIGAKRVRLVEVLVG